MALARKMHVMNAQRGILAPTCSCVPRLSSTSFGRRRSTWGSNAEKSQHRMRVQVAAPQKLDAGLLSSDVKHGQPRTPQTEREAHFEPLTSMWEINAQLYGGFTATQDPHRSPAVKDLTYRELHHLILDFAAGLQTLGLGPGEKVSLFSENSSRWIVADQGVMLNGAADAVRGALSPAEELAFIVSHSQSTGLIVQDEETLNQVMTQLDAATISALKFIVVLWEHHPQPSAAGNGGGPAAGLHPPQQLPDNLPCAVTSFDAVRAAGRVLRAAGGFKPYRNRPDDVATLVYTSGTTGHPKGVVLSHSNLKYQIDNFDGVLQVQPGDSTLSLLPPWHIYQRTVAYYLYSCGAREVFTSIRKFREDLTVHPPDHFVCVPLVLDTLHNKVMAKLKTESEVKKALIFSLLAASQVYVKARRLLKGTSLNWALAPPPLMAVLWAKLLAAVLKPLHALAHKLVYTKVRAALGVRQTLVSGGGSLAAHLDLFYEVIGLPVLNGWGLTETSPVLAVRRGDPAAANVRGSVGPPLPGTSVKAVDPTTHEALPPGQQGLLLARGPGVMVGYWRDPEATLKAFVEGWFDTGDLGWVAPEGVAGSRMGGHVVLTGRAKDTIVLSSGKNIEPQPIEDAVQCSPLIKHIILVGQDKRELGALVFPDEEALAEQAAAAAAGRGANGALAADSAKAGGAAISTEGAALEGMLLAEVTRYNSLRPDFHPEDHLAHIKVLRAPLSVEAGTLTRTLKPRRAAIVNQYAAELEELMAALR